MEHMLITPRLRKRALKHIKATLALRLPKDVLDSIKEAQHRLQMPLTEVLDKVPGDTVTERCENIKWREGWQWHHISRQTYYQWLRGFARPSPTQAAVLAKLTRIPIHKIRARAKDEL